MSATERECTGEHVVELKAKTQVDIFRHIAGLAKHYNITSVNVEFTEEDEHERAVVVYS